MLTIGAITIDTTDALSLAKWWAEQTGATILEENDGWFVVMQLPETGQGHPGQRIAFQKVDDPTPGKNRIHLDLATKDRVAERSRLVGVGAKYLATHEIDGFYWDVLTDPEGNQFCVSEHH